mmetsp:Transcript_19726/g.49569  ORF Transcript_19726/g.49569 Transcript_19726/m.49569 type:complete len:252 (+) Transcript_19726:1427-2182(+)
MIRLLCVALDIPLQAVLARQVLVVRKVVHFLPHEELGIVDLGLRPRPHQIPQEIGRRAKPVTQLLPVGLAVQGAGHDVVHFLPRFDHFVVPHTVVVLQTARNVDRMAHLPDKLITVLRAVRSLLLVQAAQEHVELQAALHAAAAQSTAAAAAPHTAPATFALREIVLIGLLQLAHQARVVLLILWRKVEVRENAEEAVVVLLADLTRNRALHPLRRPAHGVQPAVGLARRWLFRGRRTRGCGGGRGRRGRT